MSSIMIEKSNLEVKLTSLQNKGNYSSYFVSIEGEEFIFNNANRDSIYGAIHQILSDLIMNKEGRGTDEKKSLKNLGKEFNTIKNNEDLLTQCIFVFKVSLYTDKINIYEIQEDIKAAPKSKSKSKNNGGGTPLSQPNSSPQINVNTNIVRSGLFSGPVFSISQDKFLVKTKYESPKPHYSSVFEESSSSLIETLCNSFNKQPYYKISCNDNLEISVSRVQEDDIINLDNYKYCSLHSKCDIRNLESISRTLKSKINNIYGFITSSGTCYDCCFNVSLSSLSNDERNEINSVRVNLEKILLSIDSNIIKFNEYVSVRDDLKRKLEFERNSCDRLEGDFIINYGKISKSSEIIPLIKSKILTTEIIETFDKGKRITTPKNVKLYPQDYFVMSSFFGSRKFQDVSLKHDIISLSLTFSQDIDDIETQYTFNIPSETCFNLMRKKGLFKLRIVKGVAVLIEKSENGQNKYKFTIQIKVSDQTISEVFEIAYDRKIINDGEDQSVILNARITPTYSPENYRCGVINVGKKIATDMGIYDMLVDNPEVFFYMGSCYISDYSYINDFINGTSDKSTVIGISENINEVKISFQEQLPEDSTIRLIADQVNDNETIVNIYKSLVEDGQIIDIGNLISLYEDKSKSKNVQTKEKYTQKGENINKSAIEQAKENFEEIFTMMRSNIYRSLCNISIIDGDILSLEDGDTIKISNEQYVNIAKFYTSIPYVNDEEKIDVFSSSIPYEDFNDFIDSIKKGLSLLSTRAKKSDLKVVSGVSTAQKIIDDMWIDETVGKKKENSVVDELLNMKTVDQDDDTRSVSSAGTALTSITNKTIDSETGEIKSKRDVKIYNEKYFDMSIIIDTNDFTVQIYEQDSPLEDNNIIISGYAAKNYLTKYEKYANFDFARMTTLYKNDSINVINENMDYITKYLFNDIEDSNFDEYDKEDLPELIENDDIDDEIYSRYLRSMILFASNTRSFRIKHGMTRKYLNIKHELDKLSPYDSQYKLKSSSIGRKNNLPKKLQAYLEMSKKLDSIFLNTQQNLIEKLGKEFFKSIFTAYQSMIDGKLIGINFENRALQIDAIDRLIKRKVQLSELYSKTYYNFLKTVEDEISDYDNSRILGYPVYIRKCDFEGKCINDLVYPGNPFFSSSINEIRYQSCLPKNIPNLGVKPIITELASPELENLIKLLFPSSSSVTISDLFGGNIEQLLYLSSDPTSHKRECACLILMLKFFEIVDLYKSNKSERNLMYQRIDELKDTLLSGKLKDKVSVGDSPNIPTITKFQDHYDKLLREFFYYIGEEQVTVEKNVILLEDGPSTRINISFNPQSILTSLLQIIDKIITRECKIIFTERVNSMVRYLIEFIRQLENVKINENGNLEHFRPFHNYSKEDAESALINLFRIITMINNDKFDTSLVLTNLKSGEVDLISNLSLTDRRVIFMKFKDLLLTCRTKSDFKAIKKSFTYYLRSVIPASTYNEYSRQCYEKLFNIGESEEFTDIQTKMIESVNEIGTLVKSIDKSKTSKEKIESSLKEQEHEIDVRKTNLLVDFSENASLVNVIVKSYENEKVSYEEDNIEFREIINNMKIQLKSIVSKFTGINNLYFKIMNSIYQDNSEINDIRLSIYKDLRLSSLKSLHPSKILNDIGESSIKKIEMYFGNDLKNLERIINRELKHHGLSIQSSNSDISKVINNSTNNTGIINTIGTYKFVYKFFQLMYDKIDNIKIQLLTEPIESIIISTNEDKPKIMGYSDELNRNLNRCYIDVFSKLDIKIRSGNIKCLVEGIQDAMTVIDSGPGLHLLSDTIEACAEYLINSNTDEKVSLLENFNNTYNRFVTFMNSIQKPISSIFLSREYNSFISVINGTLSEFKPIISNIEFFDIIPKVFAINEEITCDLFRSMIEFFPWLINFFDSGEGKHEDDNTKVFVNYFNTLTGNEYEEIEDLTKLFSGINVAIIPFIDEYIDNNGHVLNDIQVIEYSSRFNLMTRGLYMKPLFKKLNLCLIKYIDSKEKELLSEIKNRFKNYVELFLSRIKKFPILDNHMLVRLA